MIESAVDRAEDVLRHLGCSCVTRGRARVGLRVLLDALIEAQGDRVLVRVQPDVVARGWVSREAFDNEHGVGASLTAVTFGLAEWADKDGVDGLRLAR